VTFLAPEPSVNAVDIESVSDATATLDAEDVLVGGRVREALPGRPHVGGRYRHGRRDAGALRRPAVFDSSATGFETWLELVNSGSLTFSHRFFTRRPSCRTSPTGTSARGSAAA
jgi:hypothetical protein